MGLWQVFPPLGVLMGIITFYRVWISECYHYIFKAPRKLFVDDWIRLEDEREEYRYHWNLKKIQNADQDRKGFKLE